MTQQRTPPHKGLCALLWRWLVLASWLASLGCTATPQPIQPPGGTGQDGKSGPFGVAQLQLQAQTRLTASMTLDIFLPADADGTLARQATPAPLVLFLQGGAVETSRYHWLMQHMASRGYVVIAPHHLLNAAILEADHATAARAAYHRWIQQPDHPLFGASTTTSPVFLMGHSLGGITAAKLYLRAPTYQGLAALGSYILPEESIASLSTRSGGSILLLAGARDGVLVPAKAKASFARLPERAYLGIIDGMTHYDWCDRVSDAELATDLPPSRPRQEVRLAARSLLDAWLDALVASPQQPSLASFQRSDIQLSRK